MGVLLSLLVSHVLGYGTLYARHTSDNHCNPNDTFIEITDSMLLEMMEDGVQGKHTYEEYNDLERRCGLENLYGYAKEWNVIDNTMTFEEFLKHPLCKYTLDLNR